MELLNKHKEVAMAVDCIIVISLCIHQVCGCDALLSLKIFLEEVLCICYFFSKLNVVENGISAVKH